jgi:hypothetical protein
MNTDSVNEESTKTKGKNRELKIHKENKCPPLIRNLPQDKNKKFS